MPPKARNTGNMDRMLGGIAEAPPTRPSGMTLVNPPVAWITPNPHQPRKVFDDAEMESLRLSIEAHGLRQPVGVQQQVDGRYLLVFGERRWRARPRARRPSGRAPPASRHRPGAAGLACRAGSRCRAG